MNFITHFREKIEYTCGTLVYEYCGDYFAARLVVNGKWLNRDNGHLLGHRYKYIIFKFSNDITGIRADKSFLYKRKIHINRLSPWMALILRTVLFTDYNGTMIEEIKSSPGSVKVENVKVRKQLIVDMIEGKHGGAFYVGHDV